MPEKTDFLYPFIEGGERDSRSLLTDLAASAEAKAVESLRLRTETLAASEDQLHQAAEAMAARFDAGGRLFTFGNGGSSTDAATVADLFASPPDGTALPALTLACDEAILTALGNDVGFDLVFSRQMIAHAHPGDMALGVSTSGNSRNVVLALEEAARREVLTLGLVGYDGGQMARAGLDHCFVVGSDSVHRIQETQAFLIFDLWRRVQSARLQSARHPKGMP
ncbi:MAG: SIS domain-containing protein [Actinomycetota bacterium]|nr:SIS domain-containing protein [Actinomycetota bacterium]